MSRSSLSGAAVTDPTYAVRVLEGDPPLAARRPAPGKGGFIGDPKTLYLKPGDNLRTGVEAFAQSIATPTSLERDALLLAASVFSADLACPRGERENFNRDITITVPVVNVQAFERLREDLEYLLYILSSDAWTLHFEQSGEGVPEGAGAWDKGKGKTLLFSGGLDSLAGAVDLLEQDGPGSLQLASHVTRNTATRQSQDALVAYLEDTWGTTLERAVVRSGGETTSKVLWYPGDDGRENTQRTRSFTFLTIAALAARRRGKGEVVLIAENGQMAIHLPLSAGRTGGFSTHTAHPEFVEQAGEFFTKLLRYPVRVTNPYLYKTKGEVVRALVERHAEAIPHSGSCWRGARVAHHTHCGECIPCLVRRVALECHGLRLPEFQRDLLAEDIRALPPEDEGRRNATEFAEFVHAFRTLPDARILDQYPEVINYSFDRWQAIAMYRRFAEEALSVFRNYPHAMALFPVR